MVLNVCSSRYILDLIVGLYQQMVKQIQEIIKPHIVPAILEHDEMSRGRNQSTSFISISKQ